jgi:tetratricopeptide (TPR) repeat protein
MNVAKPRQNRFDLYLLLCLCLLAALAATPGWAAEGAEVKGSRGTVTIPTYLWGPDDVNPQFTWIFGRPIYPYPMQDNLSREKVDKAYDTLVIENECLRVTVIPELGGHVHSVFDKTANREMFYVNQVVKPGLIGMRGAWISGGIEFNTGPQGHTVTAVSPVSCRIVEQADGAKTIAVGNIERVFRTQWVANVTLRPGRKALEERIRIFNPTPYVQLYYFWNCTAVPNTDGTQFIYPMTLGSDHAGTSFFRWPIDKGVDMTMSKNYRGPTSIFAYECDQDFFGSYDHSVDHGIVAYANHFDLPGKKAWTWGRGPEGIAAQATLTDDGTLYNEVQTGPLVTQADYGILQPHQTVEWTEWWYPVHGIDGYEFATRDVAVNVAKGESGPAIKMIGTAAVENAELRVLRDGREVVSRNVSISPSRPTLVEVGQKIDEPFTIEVRANDRVLASFTHPLPLPKREEPDLEARKNPLKTARDYWAAGVLADKESKPQDARKQFEKALELDPALADAHLSLAILDLEAGLPAKAKPHLEQVLERDADNGMAHYYLARALLELGDEAGALEQAWRASRDRAAASIGLGLAGEIYIRRRQRNDAVAALQRAVEKDTRDILNRNLLALALYEAGRPADALAQAREVAALDPLDALAAFAVERLGDAGGGPVSDIARRLRAEPQTVLEVVALLYRLKEYRLALGVFAATSLAEGATATPISYYYAAVLADLAGYPEGAQQALAAAAKQSTDYVFPDRLETESILKHAAKLAPTDWRIQHYLGCLYLGHYRKDEAVEAWRKAVDLGADSSVVYRNLGIVSWKLDDNVDAAIPNYEKAVALRPDDPVLYRDLATLYQRKDQWAKARDVLEKTLAFKQYRGDVIELLARTYYHLGEHAKTAALIDARTFHQWEGQRSLYEIYRDTHMALGRAALDAGDAKKAAAEFRRALEYPKNLGVGRPDRAREAEPYYRLGQALAADKQLDEARAAWKKAAEEGSKREGDFPALAAKALKDAK